MNSITRYGAFLRGINVSGHRIIKMAALRDLLVSLGFNEVKTVLASGNIAFNRPDEPISESETVIAAAIKDYFQLDVPVIVLTRFDLSEIVESAKGAPVDPEAKVYITFFDVPCSDHPELTLPPKGVFTVLDRRERSLTWSLRLSRPGDTPVYMKMLEAAYGKTITTRTFKTVEKLLSQ